MVRVYFQFAPGANTFAVIAIFYFIRLHKNKPKRRTQLSH